MTSEPEWEMMLPRLKAAKVRGIRRHMPEVCEHRLSWDRLISEEITALQVRHDRARTAVTRKRIAGLIDERTMESYRWHTRHNDICPRISDNSLRNLLNGVSVPRSAVRKGLLRVAALLDPPPVQVPADSASTTGPTEDGGPYDR